jgi:ATP-dependent RNA helicase DeaD
MFRDLIASYEEEHKVPAAEIAAALAVMVQGDQPFFVRELPSTPEFQKRDRNKDGFGSRGPSRGVTEGNATYRIAVGRRQRVMPGSIVGALANEGGFHSSQIGGIDIRADHSLVELPAELSSEQWKALSKTRIGGELIKLELDTGRRPNRERDGERSDRGFGARPDRGDRGGFAGRSDRGDRGGRGFGRDDRGFGGRSDRGDRGGFGARSFGERKPRQAKEGGRGRKW